MTLLQIAGSLGIALGAVLLVFAWRASMAPIEQLTEAATGRFTQTTMLYLIGGILVAAAGVLTLLFGARAV
jgi:hypothetical protein